jgi:hypothetical protein
MPEESANTEYGATTGTPAQANRAGPTEGSTGNYKLDYPAWHKPYAEALLETDPEILVKLLAATEIAVFERFLELAASEDVSDERQDIRRAINVMLTLKARKTQAGSTMQKTCSSASRAKLVLHHNGKVEYSRSLEIPTEGKGTAAKMVISLQEPARQNRLTRSATE